MADLEVTCATMPMAAEALLPKTMRAVGMTRRPEVGGVALALEMLEVPTPHPKHDEAVVRVEASAMHIDDIHIAQGTALGRFLGPKRVSAANPYIIGSTVAGTVAKVGSHVDGLKVGDKVFSVHNATGDCGSWAEYRAVKSTALLPIPQSMSPTQSSALSLAASVAWGAIENAAVGSGARVCIVGASGGIGCILTQMLISIGCDVTAVCSGRNAEFVRSLAVDRVVDYTRCGFGDAPANTYDVVFDMVGGQEIENSAFRVLTRSGRFVTVTGPEPHIGQRKLSWLRLFGMLAHIFWRSATTRVRGPRYVFSDRIPKKTIRPALRFVTKHDITMPIEAEIPLEIEPIRKAIGRLTDHRVRGRLVITPRASQHPHQKSDDTSDVATKWKTP